MGDLSSTELCQNMHSSAHTQQTTGVVIITSWRHEGKVEVPK